MTAGTEQTPQSSGGGERYSGGGARRAPGGPRPKKFTRSRRKVCVFCVNKVKGIDYKQVLVQQYRNKLVTDRGKILPRRTTGTCAKHQRMVAEAVKQARQIAILPFVAD